MKFEILDTTLRDGEQTSGVAFSASEKLSIARKLLEEVGVDRIEIASARVSNGEFQCVSKVCEWAKEAGYLDRIEVLGFCDNGASIEWISKAGGKVINLLTKGSEKHCIAQLGKQPAEHWADVHRNIDMAIAAGLSVNIYLEDWSNGMLHSPMYVMNMMKEMSDAPIQRFMLPDTLGILSPSQTKEFFEQMVAKYPKLHFDFHAHNDYDLAVANVLAAVKAGARGVHTTVNGLGERAGNASLPSVVAVIKDMVPGSELNIIEQSINSLSRMVESYSGIATAPNAHGPLCPWERAQSRNSLALRLPGCAFRVAAPGPADTGRTVSTDTGRPLRQRGLRPVERLVRAFRPGLVSNLSRNRGIRPGSAAFLESNRDAPERTQAGHRCRPSGTPLCEGGPMER